MPRLEQRNCAPGIVFHFVFFAEIPITETSQKIKSELRQFMTLVKCQLVDLVVL